MYFDEPKPAERPAIEAERGMQVVLGVNACGLVLILPWIGWLRDLCQAAITSIAGAAP
jgi:hypothetical protein